MGDQYLLASAPVTLSILGHEEVISLEITKLGNYPVILGLPWLSQHHPQVNWSDQSIVFASPYCLAQCLRHSGGSQQIRNSGNLSGSIASDTPPLNNSKSRRVTVPHTPASRQVTAANPYNSGPSQDISCERVSFPRSALKTALVYGVTSTPELNPHPAEDDDNSVSDIKSIQQSVPTLTSYQTTDITIITFHLKETRDLLLDLFPVCSRTQSFGRLPKGEPQEGIHPSQFQPGGFTHPLRQEI